MATITAAQAGNWNTTGNNWSDTASWTGGSVPGNGDTADLNGCIIIQDIATIPASGTLLALTSAGSAGQLKCVVATGALATLVINATTITAGTVGSAGTIAYSGTTGNGLTINCTNINGCASGGTSPRGIVRSSTKPLTVVCAAGGAITGGGVTNADAIQSTGAGNVTITGNLVGGSATAAQGLSVGAAGTVTITGNLTGGNGTNANGVYVWAASVTINITGNITGGSGITAAGFYMDHGTALTSTLNSCNLINSSSSLAWHGPPPTTWNLVPGYNSIQYGTQYFYPRTGSAYGSATLAKETGANARGGSGTCAKLTATSTTQYGFWEFYVPATATTAFTFSLYYKAFHTTTAWNGTLDVSIYDTDDTTLKNTNESVSITDDAAYHQWSATAVTPTATGLCRVTIRVKNGSDSGGVYIDDIAVA